MTNNLNPQHKFNIVYNWVVLFVILIIFSISAGCNAERKLLRPYKAVNSDVDTSYKAKKKELIARVCATAFPIEIKTITKDSIVNRIVKVQDNNLISKLKKLLQDCNTKTIDVDSILNNYAIVDTIYIDHYHNTTSTIKDTIGNWRKANEIELLHNENILLNANLDAIKDDLKESEAHSKALQKERNKWRLYFFGLLIIGIGYKVAKTYLKSKFTLPKIF